MTRPAARERDVHVFVVWSRGREREAEILADLAREFDVLDVRSVEWSAASFSASLTRLYGQSLPPGSDKERHCGTGPFLLAVVADPRPAYARRRLRGTRRRVNARVLTAKERHRGWTGGGHRVHASLDPDEAEWNLRLLLGRSRADYAGAAPWDGVVREHAADPVGASGWASVGELEATLRPALGPVAVTPRPGDGLVVASDDAWWAAVIANGRPGVKAPDVPVHEVDVGGEARTVEFRDRRPVSPRPRRRRGAEDALAAALEALARALPRRAGLVVVHHGVAERAGREEELVPALSVDELERQLAVVAGRYRAVPASALLDAVRDRRRGTPVPVAVTFDDDLASHAELAAPALERAGVPATFFLTGATLDGPAPAWWERLQALADAGRFDEVRAPLAAAGADATSIRAAARTIEALEPARRREVEETIREAASGLPAEPGVPRDAVARLAQAGFEIGFHTLRHELLPALDDADLRRALVDGRSALEDAAGAPVTVLAYPHGKADARVAAAAQAAGFVAGFAGVRGRVDTGTDPFLVPRNELRAGPRPFRLAAARLVLGLDQSRR